MKQSITILLMSLLVEMAYAQGIFFATVDLTTGSHADFNHISNSEFNSSFSALNHMNGEYYFQFHDSENMHSTLYTIDVQTGSVLSNTQLGIGSDYFNVHALACASTTGVLYGLLSDNETPNRYFISLDPNSGVHTLISELPEVAYTLQIVAIDEVNGYYFFLGAGSNQNWKIYTIDIDSGEVISNPLFPDFSRLCSLEFDNSSQILYALLTEQVSSSQTLVEVNPSNGSLDIVSSIPNVTYVLGNTTFDQMQGRLIFKGSDFFYNSNLYSIDVNTGEVVTDPIFPILTDSMDQIVGLEFDNTSGICYSIHYVNDFVSAGYGCTDINACNYSESSINFDGLCCWTACGCSNQMASNYDPEATCDNGSCQFAISGLVYHDVWSDGYFNEDDYGLANQTIITEDGAMVYITDDNGFFSGVVDDEETTFLHVTDPNFPYYSSSSSFSSTWGWNWQCGLSMNEPLANLETAIYHDWYVCDDEVTFNITYRNTGNTILNGQVEFTYDPLILGYTEMSAITIVEGTTLTFDFVDLMPGEQQIKQVRMHTPDFTFMGEMMDFSVDVIGYSAEELDAWGNDVYQIEHGCSYDPNDIQATPEGFTDAHFIEDGTVIEYLVRFQNTGNAPALNIRIDNTIDPNLDLSSFQFVANSHDVSMAINNETRQVQIYFDEIMLPDSTENEAESHGFLSYRIAISQPLETGVEINNTASIYFDNNPAVVTNTTWHTIYNCEEFDVQLNADESQWCASQTVNVNAILPWADAYMWSVNGEVVSELDELQITEPGEKQITLVVDNPLCGVFEESITLNLEEVQLQSIQSSATTVCEGETVDLSAVETSDSYLWSSNGNTISTEDNIQVSASGTYQLTTTNGLCQQTNSINIVVTPLPEANITQSANLLSTQTNSNWTYQWYMNDELIIGATTNTYEIEASGMYQVVVMNGSCEQSAEINASYIGVEENTDATWSWYPNPVADELTLICTADQIDQQLEVVDVTGRMVYSIRIIQAQLSLDMSNWSSGVYTLRMDDGTAIGQVLKN